MIDPNQVICDEEKCKPIMDGILLYRDEFHLNDAGSRLIVQALLDMGVTL